MRRSPSSRRAAIANGLLLAALGNACGPAHVFHKDPERGCAAVMLAGQEDVAAAAGCPAVESLTIRTGMALDLRPLGRLQTIRGALSIGPSVGLSEVSLPRLQEAGSIKIIGNGDLHGVFLPKLERVGALEIASNHALTTISLPQLVTAGAVAITEDPALELIDLAKLTGASEIRIASTPRLAVVEGELPALRAAIPAPPASDPTLEPVSPP